MTALFKIINTDRDQFASQVRVGKGLRRAEWNSGASNYQSSVQSVLISKEILIKAGTIRTNSEIVEHWLQG